MIKSVLSCIALVLFFTVHAKANQLLNDNEIDARLNFLESSLYELKKPSYYWQYGWSGFYGISSATQLYEAVDEDDSDDEVVYWVGAVKSAGALAMIMLKPLPIVHDLSEYEQMPTNSREQKLAKLNEAESLLRRSALRVDDRHTWKPHLLTVGVNLIGAAAIAAFGDSDDALGSMALGIALGEAAIWTQPSAAKQHWQKYQHKINGVERNAKNWQLIPGYNSVALKINF